MNRCPRPEIPGVTPGNPEPATCAPRARYGPGFPDWLLASLLVAAVLTAPPAQAREGDRAQPATIEADRAEIDRASGKSVYFGDVVFEQGTLHLTGDRLTIFVREGIVERAEARGEPARIRQETDDGRMVRAHGRTIDYDATDGLIVLTGDAELQRNGERFAAGRIRYWPDSGRVEGGRGDDGERVQIRIEPDAGNGSSEGEGGGEGDDSP